METKCGVYGELWFGGGGQLITRSSEPSLARWDEGIYRAPGLDTGRPNQRPHLNLITDSHPTNLFSHIPLPAELKTTDSCQ